MRSRLVAAFAALTVAIGCAAVPALAGKAPASSSRLAAAPGQASAAGTSSTDSSGAGPTGAANASPQAASVVPASGTPLVATTTTTTPPCTDTLDAAVEFEIDMPNDSRNAHGFYAVPDTNPVGLVVFSHGYGHSSYSWQRHIKRVADQLDVVAVAMDGRDLTFLASEKAPGIPNTAGWPVKSAAEDGLAAAKLFEANCSTIDTIVNYGVSMGGNTSGLMAAAGALRADGVTPLFDWWVDVEGVNNLLETYMEARAADPNAAGAIQTEAGGPIEAVGPAPYLAMANVANVDKMKAAGLQGVVLVHGVDDGLVPHNQSDEMFAALTAAGIPSHFYAVTLKSDQTERETSGTGHVLGRIDPAYRSPLAGHASEMSETHIVSLLGFERLNAIFAGQPPACHRLVVVDGQAGRTPQPAC